MHRNEYLNLKLLKAKLLLNYIKDKIDKENTRNNSFYSS